MSTLRCLALVLAAICIGTACTLMLRHCRGPVADYRDPIEWPCENCDETELDACQVEIVTERGTVTLARQ